MTRGIHESAEIGLLSEIGKMTFAFIPAKTTFVGDILKAIFGITQTMDAIQLSLYSAYVSLMTWSGVWKKNKTSRSKSKIISSLPH